MIDLNLTYPVEAHPSWAIVDSTKLQCFMACPRKFFLEYALGWRPQTPSNHLIFGQAWHEALEHMLNHGFSNNVIVEAFDKFMLTYREVFPEGTDGLFAGKTPENALKGLIQYAQQYSTDMYEYEVLMTEVGGQVYIREDRPLTFKMDAVVRRLRDDARLVMEHKTGSRFTSLWEMQWALSIQCGTYTFALDCMNQEPTGLYGLIVNGAFFQPKKIEFHRVPVMKQLKMRNVWMNAANAWYEALENEFAILATCKSDDAVLLAFPQNPTACTDYGGCTFHDFCTCWPNPLEYAAEAPIGFRVEHWNPLEMKTIKHMVGLNK